MKHYNQITSTFAFIACSAFTLMPQEASAIGMACGTITTPGYLTVVCQMTWEQSESFLYEEGYMSSTATINDANPVYVLDDLTLNGQPPYTNTRYVSNPQSGNKYCMQASGHMNYFDFDEVRGTYPVYHPDGPVDDDACHTF